MKQRRGNRGRAALNQRKLLRANLATLRQQDPELATLLEAPPSSGRFRTERVGDEVRNLHLRDADGAELPWHAEGEEGVAVRLPGDAELGGVSIVFLLGLGLGHELVALSRRPSLQLHTVIVIEPDIDVARIAFRATKLSKAIGGMSIRFLIGWPLNRLTAELDQLWRDSQYLRLCKAALVFTPEGARRFQPAYHREVETVVRHSIEEGRRSFGNSAMDEMMGLEHTLRNLPLATSSSGLSALVGALQGRPAVLAAGGPSLGKHLDRLRNHQDDVLIICPDTSLRALMGAGIEPHLVTSRERTPNMGRHYEGLPLKRSRLAGLGVLHPSAFDAFQGGTVAIGRASGHSPWLWPDGPWLRFLGSSGNMAYMLAVVMGCDPIILIGQDLAFGEDGRTHAVDCAFGDRQAPYLQAGRVQVDGYGGGTAFTTATWLRLLGNLQNDIVRNPGRTVNCTEGGARIEGAVEQPFEDALAEHVRPGPQGSAQAALDRCLAGPDTRAELAEAGRLHALILNGHEQLQAVVARCSAALAEMSSRRAVPLPDHLRGMPPYVAPLLVEKPIAPLQAARVAIVSMPGFNRVVMPCAQSALTALEVEMYALQRQSTDGADLCKQILPFFERWVDVVQTVAAGTLELLAWGEHSLHGAYPSLPAPRRALPGESMADIWQRSNPRFGDRVRAGTSFN